MAVEMDYLRRQTLEARCDQAIAAGIGITSAGVALVPLAVRPASPLLAPCLVGLGVAWLLFRSARSRAWRARVGAQSELRTRQSFGGLLITGWQMLDSVSWPRRGDIDHVVVSPSGTGFVVETKTSRYTRAHLARTREAAMLVQTVRGGAPTFGVLCVARAQGLDRVEEGVHIVSPDTGERVVRALDQSLAARA